MKQLEFFYVFAFILQRNNRRKNLLRFYLFEIEHEHGEERERDGEKQPLH